MTNIRNTPTYLAKTFHTLQQTKMIDLMMDAVSNNEQYLKTYAKYNNMKIYSDVATIAEIIK